MMSVVTIVIVSPSFGKKFLLIMFSKKLFLFKSIGYQLQIIIEMETTSDKHESTPNTVTQHTTSQNTKDPLYPHVVHVPVNRPFYLQCKINDKYLCVTTTKSEVTLQLANLKPKLSHMWIYTSSGAIVSATQGSYALEIKGGDKSNRAHLVLSKLSKKPYQKWKFLSNGTIVSEYHGKAIHFQVLLYMWDYTGSLNQQWTIHNIFNERFILRNVPFLLKSKLKGTVMDVCRGLVIPGTNIITYEKHGKSNQQFIYKNEGYIVSAAGLVGSLCLDIAHASYEDGAQIHLWRIHGKANQRWFSLF